MPGHVQRLRPCPRLHSIARSVLAKSLERAFYVLGKRGLRNAPAAHDVYFNHITKRLCERDDLSPVQQIRNYISPRLPSKYRQELVDEIISDMSSPEFDIDKLITAIEFEFKSHDAVAHTSDMNHVMQVFLKCLLLGYVYKLNLSPLYVNESCWVARARRVLCTWNQSDKDDPKVQKFKYTKIRNDDKVETEFFLSMWRDMGLQNRLAVTEAALATAPAFQHLTAINVDYMATGELIWEIGKYCTLLQDLSLFMDTTDRRIYSMHFEDDLVMSLSSLYGHKITTQVSFPGKAFGCPKLQRVVLPFVELQDAFYLVVGRMLLYLHRLKEMINGPTTKALDYLFSETDYNGKPLSLTHIEDTASDESIENLMEYHEFEPESVLAKVTSAKVLQTKERGGLQCLAIFPKLKNLEVLTDEELEFSIPFTNITHFKGNCRWDQKKLALFSRRAPKLEVFVFADGSISRHKNFKDSMSFPSLRVVKFYHLGRADPEPFTALLRGTRCLTHLILEDASEGLDNHRSLIRNLNDKIICSFLPSLKKLVVFHAAIMNFGLFKRKSKFSLTMKSVKNFLHCCPDLSYIGCLYHWDISDQEIEVLKEQIRQKNWNLHLESVDIAIVG